MARERATRAFLWLTALAGGPLLGAKLFELLVLAGARSAQSAPNPGNDALWQGVAGRYRHVLHSLFRSNAGCRLGGLAAGWKTPWRYRWLLSLPSIGILALLILTVVAFWPMNAALYYHGAGSPKDSITDAQSIAMARRWVQLDWARVAGATAAFVAALRALTVPWPQEVAAEDPPIVRILLMLALMGVTAFVIWFVSNI